MQTHELIVPLDELARKLGLSQRWLRKAATDGQIPFLQAGRHRVFNVDAVRRALADHAAKGKGATDE